MDEINQRAREPGIATKSQAWSASRQSAQKRLGTCSILISSYLFTGSPFFGLTMAQFIVRHLEETVKARLKRRAARHGRSMEDEVRHILRDAVKAQNHHVSKLGSRIAAHFAKVGLT